MFTVVAYSLNLFSLVCNPVFFMENIFKSFYHESFPAFQSPLYSVEIQSSIACIPMIPFVA
jgi:hypothetical protein